MNKMVRISAQAGGLFQLEVVTLLPADRSALLNLTDNIQKLDGLTFDQLVVKLREVFPEIANP